MIREIREEKIGREEVYAKYFSLTDSPDSMTEDFYKTIEKAKRLFGNSKKMVVLIRGQIFTQDGNLNYCTFLDKEYNVDKLGLEDAIRDIDLFSCFMNNENPENRRLYFSVPEQQYIAQRIVANAKIIINVE